MGTLIGAEERLCSTLKLKYKQTQFRILTYLLVILDIITARCTYNIEFLFEDGSTFIVRDVVASQPEGAA